MAQPLLLQSCRASSKKRIRIFNGRLRALLLVFQRRRKQLRQKGASTLLADFPNKENKRQDQGKNRRGDNGKDGQRKGARIATGFGSGAPSHGSKPLLGERMRRWLPVSPSASAVAAARAALNRAPGSTDGKPPGITRRFDSSNDKPPPTCSNKREPTPTPKRGKTRARNGQEGSE